MKKINILIVLVLVCFVFSFEIAEAIPAFARKYAMSCKTCHSPMPRLKAYGDEFAGNGFKLPEKEAPRYFLETGDEQLSLIRDFPVAARLEGHITYNYGNSENSDFGVPFILKLLSGGEITKDIAYYFYFYMSERGELAGVEDCYIMFNNLLGIDLDLYFGQFQVSDPLFKRELRLSLEDYQVYKTKPGISKMNLAYDRGIMLTLGLDWGMDLIFEMVNGCGLTHADARKLFDIDGHKTLIGRISQDIGDFARVGGFALYGKEDMKNAINNTITNEVFTFGPDLTFSLGEKAELNFQYIHRTDKNLFLSENDINPSKDLETKGIMTELIVTPDGDDSRFYGAALFNWIESDYKALNYKTATLHLGYLLKRNLRIVLEGTYNFTDNDKNFTIFSLGFVNAF
jgi:hypothetical protein